MSRWTSRLLAPALLALLSGGAVAGSATTVRATALRDAPAATAATLAKLKAETVVEILKRQGGWYQARAGAASGWVKLLDVRLGAAAARPGDNGLAAMSGAVAGRTGTTAATGVRGLDEEKLSRATPNHAELSRMQANAVRADEGARFGKDGGLTARPVPYADE